MTDERESGAAAKPYIYMQWSDDGQHIRKWSPDAFDGGLALYASPPRATAQDGDKALMREAVVEDSGILLPPASELSQEYLDGWCDGQTYLLENQRTTPASVEERANAATDGRVEAAIPLIERARIAAASVRPNSPWAKRVLAGHRDDDDAVKAAIAALREVKP